MRFLICLVVAVVAARYSYVVATHVALHRDFGQLWFAARELLHGRNAYARIGPGLAYDWFWPLYYPLPAVVAVTPLAPLPEAMALALVSAISLGAFAWALSENGYAPLLGLWSMCTWHALNLVQWSPLLSAGFVIAPLSALWIVKPTTGLALFAARPTWWAVVGAVVLTTIAFILQPSWPFQWWAALNSPNVAPGYQAGHFAIVQFTGGALVLAALARWRRPEARLLTVLACVPQTLLPYEALPLFLIPRGWIESAVLLVFSFAVRWWALRSGAADFASVTPYYGQAATLGLYLPATLMVLRRPNVGAVPAWLEGSIGSWPTWMRGRSINA